MEGRVQEVRRFAVKSMRGESLPACPIDAGGLRGDRAYALLDEETGKVASAKRPRMWSGLLAMSASYAADAGPGQPLLVDMGDGTPVRSDTPDFDARLSSAVGRRVRLLSQPEAGAGYDDEWPDIDGLAPEEFVTSTRTSTSDDGLAVSTLPVGLLAPGTFQDVSPVTVLTTASLRAAARLQPASRWDPRRFRANLLLDFSGEGFLENDWIGRRLTVGGAVLEILAPTPRCVMTTLAQEDLPADRDILRTVAAHNRADVPGTGRFACLGVYASVVTPGPVAVGDRSTVD